LFERKKKNLFVTIGQSKGTMSINLREFIFAEVGAQTWIGEESMFAENFRSSYSVRAKTVITVLEFATADLNDLMRRDYKEYLQEVALKKHILLLERIKEIIKSSKQSYQEQELSNFYKSISDTISQLYPSASNKIAR
jgi:CRP-like cAMP-binding protein